MNTKIVDRAAAALAQEIGLINITREALCARAGIQDGSFAYVMGCNFTNYMAGLLEDGELPLGEGPATKSRVGSKFRREQILSVAVAVAREKGYQKMTRADVAFAASVSQATVSKYFGTMTQLKRAVMRSAVHREALEVVAQGLAVNDEHARRAPQVIKDRAAAFIASA